MQVHSPVRRRWPNTWLSFVFGCLLIVLYDTGLQHHDSHVPHTYQGTCSSPPCSQSQNHSRQEALKALAVLQGHHSRSALVGPASRLLQASWTMDNSRGHQQGWGWQCPHCKQKCKAAATFCQFCGTPWWYVAEDLGPPAPWTAQDSQLWLPADQWRSKSPNRLRSPRGGQPKGKGKGIKGGAKNTLKGKGKGTSSPAMSEAAKSEAPIAPAAAALPASPAIPSLPTPKPAVTETASSSAERKMLEALIPYIKDAEGLPSSLRDSLQSLASKNPQLEARSLHNIITQRTKARQALARLEVEEDRYHQAWVSYMEELTTLLQKQLAERQQTEERFQTQRVAWKESWKMLRRRWPTLLPPESQSTRSRRCKRIRRSSPRSTRSSPKAPKQRAREWLPSKPSYYSSWVRLRTRCRRNLVARDHERQVDSPSRSLWST